MPLKLILFISLLISSGLSIADSERSSALSQISGSLVKTYLTLGGFAEDEGDRSGLEISGLMNTSNNHANRISGVLYSGRNDDKIMDLFSGFSFTRYHHLNDDFINPYFGLGLFIGDTFNCSDDDAEKDCEEDFVFTVYPEVALAINVGNLHIFPYIRRYNFIGHNSYGLNVGFKF
jgi:hypothetical protein